METSRSSSKVSKTRVPFLRNVNPDECRACRAHCFFTLVFSAYKLRTVDRFYSNEVNNDPETLILVLFPSILLQMLVLRNAVI